MQESEEQSQEEVIHYVPSDKFVFHTCPLCESLARFPEKSKTPSYFEKIRAYLTSLEKETLVEEQK